jgi:plastocyanin
MAGTAFALRDVSALGVTAALVAAVVWVRLRRTKLACAVAAIVLADIEFFTASAAVSNLRDGGRVVPVAVPAAVAAASVVGLAGAIALFARRAPLPAVRPLGPRAGVWAGAATGVVLAVVLLVAPELHVGHARPGEIALTARTTAFSRENLQARPGRVGVFVANHDLFWHTFTIDRLHVDVGVPVGGARHTRFTAPPGTYEYYCRVPGHRQAGMKGTLIVS